MFQPRTGTPPDLGPATDCYVDILLNPLLPSPPVARFPPRGAARARPIPISLFRRRASAQDHSPTRASPVSVP